MKRAFVHFLTCATFIGSLSLPAVTHAKGGEAAVSQVDFCKVAQSPKDFASQRISFSARYRSDGQHFEFLENLSCGRGKQIIDIGRHGESASVHAFYSEIDHLCVKANAPLVCNTFAEITVTGVIREATGVYYIDVNDVTSYKFFSLHGAPVNSEER
jgi:hypothetical protein